MRHHITSLLLVGLSSLVAAIYRDEVGHIDFHHSLVGLPQTETTFFHRPRIDDKASLLYTLSDVGVLGAVNPSNGALVWRQQLAEEATVGAAKGFLRAPDQGNWVVASQGNKVQAWNALTGRNIWHNEFEGEAVDLEILEITDSTRKDVLSLFREDGVIVVRRLHGALGTVVWEFRETTKDVPVQVSTNIAHGFLISLHGSPTSYSLRITSLDIVTGARTDTTTIGTKGEVHSPEDIMFVGGNSAAPMVGWTDNKLSKLSVHVLGARSGQEIGLSEGTKSVEILAPHLLQSLPHFLVHMRSENGNRAEVYRTDLKTGKISKAYELPQLPGPGAFAVTSEGANVYFTRFTNDEVILTSSESFGILARWQFKPSTKMVPVQAVAEIIKKPGGEGYAIRAAALTADQDWVLVRNGEVDWLRPEGMSGAVAATWAEIPEGENLAKVLEEEAHTNAMAAYVHRVQRHIDDLKYLPGWLSSLPARITDSVLGTEVSSTTQPQRDTFGFSKILVVVTGRGRAYGLNSGNKGAVIWSTDLLNLSAGQTLDVKGIVARNAEGTVTVRGSRGEFATVQTLTGQLVHSILAGAAPDIAATAVLPSSHGPWILPLAADGSSSEPIPAELTPEAVVVTQNGNAILKGLRFYERDAKVESEEIWQLQMLPSYRIVATASPDLHDPVASIGRVLGDRRVNYKYLNPNIIVVASIDDATSSLSVQVVDSVSGQVLASQLYKGVDASKPINCVTSENWYTCTFYGDYIIDDGNQTIKGYQIVVTDLYESPSANDRGPLGDAETFSSLKPVDTPNTVPLPWVVSQAFVTSQPLTSLAVTQTRQGVTNRQLLAYLPDSHAIVGIQRQLLDPRRPVGRLPTPAEIEAEGLARYSPALEIDSRSLISHMYEIIGTRGITVSPAAIESTSLVAAYGVDVYASRVSPSGTFDVLGKGFNKLTVVATVISLFWAVTLIAPFVRRKQINRRWEAPT